MPGAVPDSSAAAGLQLCRKDTLLLHPDLAIEEGRTLREKHGEGRQGRILHLIEPGVASLAPVRQSPECIPNLLDQGDGGARQGDGGNG